MTEVIHITENAGQPAARVSALSLSQLGVLIGNSLPTTDPLEVNALWSDGGVLSVSPKPLAVADFKNGVYLLNGASATLSDMLVPTRYYTEVPEPTLTAGVGWNNVGSGGVVQHSGYSASAALLALMDLTGEGCSMVVDFTATNPGAGECAFTMPMGNYPDWSLGWSASLNVRSDHFSPEVEDFINPDPQINQALPAQGKVAFNLSYDLLSAVANGGNPASLEPPDPSENWTNPSFIDLICNAQDVGSQFLIRSIKWYPPQEEASDLQLLSV